MRKDDWHLAQGVTQHHCLFFAGYLSSLIRTVMPTRKECLAGFSLFGLCPRFLRAS